MYYNAKPSQPEERLFLNTIPFELPQEPLTFWFYKEDIPGIHLKRLTHINRPVGIETIFPGLKNNEFIYTSFTERHNGMTALEVDLNDHANYYFLKRWLNGKINHYFKVRGLPVQTDFITKDNIIWKYDKNGNKRSDCAQYDRYTLKVDWDEFNSRPQLLLTYDRPSLVYSKSVAQLLEENQGNPFSGDAPDSFNLSLVKKVFYKTRRKDGKPSYKIDKYDFLAKDSAFAPVHAYPIMWPALAEFVGLPPEEAEEDDTYSSLAKPKNRYPLYYNKINFFYKQYLDNDDFRSIINISPEGFAWAEKLQTGMVSSSSQELVFGGGDIKYVPQKGVNSGPFEKPQPTNIQIMFIFHKEDRNSAANLLRYLIRDGYKQFFKGLIKYIGQPVTAAPNGFHLIFEDRNNPIPEVRTFLQNLQKDTGATYLAIYLTPFSKHTHQQTEKEIYYQVKKLLMDYGIPSQCIETEKMLLQLENDKGTDSKGRELKNFAYTLQNMSIAINAKLGGIPWRISAAQQDELVIGVGAFRTQDGTHYIGSAFSFENTGIFNSFNYFLKDEMQELAGAIEEAIINFSTAKGKPTRLIIHYYKVMREEEADILLDRLHKLNLDIPVYIVSINKTESEDKVLFDGASNDFMPYSGRYINLGADRYLLCNNTRYKNAAFNPWDGFPFPVKLRIESINTADAPDANTIRDLINQIYQFSRIYWKSVKQQNLPVTIKYPEMVAEIAPHFNGAGIPPQFESRLWFL